MGKSECYCSSINNGEKMSHSCERCTTPEQHFQYDKEQYAEEMIICNGRHIDGSIEQCPIRKRGCYAIKALKINQFALNGEILNTKSDKIK